MNARVSMCEHTEIQSYQIAELAGNFILLEKAYSIYLWRVKKITRGSYDQTEAAFWKAGSLQSRKLTDTDRILIKKKKQPVSCRSDARQYHTGHGKAGQCV